MPPLAALSLLTLSASRITNVVSAVLHLVLSTILVRILEYLWQVQLLTSLTPRGDGLEDFPRASFRHMHSEKKTQSKRRSEMCGASPT